MRCKSTVADFEYAMLYGISTFPETDADALMHHKPMDGRGFSGKAYLKKDGEEYLVERSFRKHNMTTQILNVKNGRVGNLAHKNSLYATLTGVDKKLYSDAYYIRQRGRNSESGRGTECIHNESCDNGSIKSGQAAGTCSVAGAEKCTGCDGSGGTDCGSAEELGQYEGDEEALQTVRKQIEENDQEFAMETARRKREARRLIDTSKGVKYEDNEELNEHLDSCGKIVYFWMQICSQIISRRKN